MSCRAPSRITSRGTSSHGTSCVTWQRPCPEASHICMRTYPGAGARATSRLSPTGTRVSSRPLFLARSRREGWRVRAGLGGSQPQAVYRPQVPGLAVALSSLDLGTQRGLEVESRAPRGGELSLISTLSCSAVCQRQPHKTLGPPGPSPVFHPCPLRLWSCKLVLWCPPVATEGSADSVPGWSSVC